MQSTRPSQPLLETTRLCLGMIKNEDAATIKVLRSDPVVNRYINRPEKISTDDALAFIDRTNKGIEERKFYYWSIRPVNEKDLIGTICLWNFEEEISEAEIGYELFPAFHGKGIMQEAVQTVIEYAQGRLGLKSLVAFTQYNNEASIRLLTKFNFSLVPELKDPKNDKNRIYRLRF